MAYYDIDSVSQYITDLVNANKVSLGLETVYYGDQTIIPAMPSVAVVPGPLHREPTGAMRHYTLRFTVALFVMHRRLMQTNAARTKADLQMARSLVVLLHTDFTLGSNIVGGWVSSEVPRSLPGPQGGSIISTQLTWIGEQREVVGNA